MSDRLTAKQERFVQGLVSGMSQREAYSSAYNVQRWKAASIDQCASRLFYNVKVRSRYDDLVADGAKKALWDRERASKTLIAALETSAFEDRAVEPHDDR